MNRPEAAEVLRAEIEAVDHGICDDEDDTRLVAAALRVALDALERVRKLETLVIEYERDHDSDAGRCLCSLCYAARALLAEAKEEP